MSCRCKRADGKIANKHGRCQRRCVLWYIAGGRGQSGAQIENTRHRDRSSNMIPGTGTERNANPDEKKVHTCGRRVRGRTYNRGKYNRSFFFCVARNEDSRRVNPGQSCGKSRVASPTTLSFYISGLLFFLFSLHDREHGRKHHVQELDALRADAVEDPHHRRRDHAVVLAQARIALNKVAFTIRERPETVVHEANRIFRKRTLSLTHAGALARGHKYAKTQRTPVSSERASINLQLLLRLQLATAAADVDADALASAKFSGWFSFACPCLLALVHCRDVPWGRGRERLFAHTLYPVLRTWLCVGVVDVDSSAVFSIFCAYATRYSLSLGMARLSATPHNKNGKHAHATDRFSAPLRSALTSSSSPACLFFAGTHVPLLGVTGSWWIRDPTPTEALARYGQRKWCGAKFFSDTKTH